MCYKPYITCTQMDSFPKFSSRSVSGQKNISGTNIITFWCRTSRVKTKLQTPPEQLKMTENITCVPGCWASYQRCCQPAPTPRSTFGEGRSRYFIFSVSSKTPDCFCGSFCVQDVKRKNGENADKITNDWKNLDEASEHGTSPNIPKHDFPILRRIFEKQIRVDQPSPESICGGV